MTKRTTKQDLQIAVDKINALTRKDYTLDHSNGGYRLEMNNQSISVSPRLKASEMATYLNAFYTGLKRGHIDLQQR